MLSFYNGLTNRKEEFVPLDAQCIKMYVCGATVYGDIHIGNARSVVSFDVIFRLLSYLYPKVIMVRNLTDIDDKINRRARELQIPADQLTEQVIGDFHAQITQLGVLPVTHEPRVTENIPEIIDLIQRLLQRGFAYESAGHVLFAVDKDPQYGCLSHRTLEDMNVGASARVSDAEISIKHHPLDFVLWKPQSPEDDAKYARNFDSPWGRGRPGWHIECSAMSHKYLGDNFDIHGGGLDLKFPHHENEIAQSCCAFPGAKFAKYWLHNGLITINGEKMSKSLGNIISLKDMLATLPPRQHRALRLVLLHSQYRQAVDHNTKILQDSLKLFDRWHRVLGAQLLEDYRHSCQRPTYGAEQSNSVFQEGVALLANDVNTPAFLAYAQQLSKSQDPQTCWTLAKLLDLVGLLETDYFATAINPTPTVPDATTSQTIEKLMAQRHQAKLQKNWPLADELRQQLTDLGAVVTDHANGTSEWRIK